MDLDALVKKLRQLKKLGIAECEIPEGRFRFVQKAEVIRTKPLPDGAGDEDELQGRPSSWYAEFARRKDEEARKAIEGPPRKRQ